MKNFKFVVKRPAGLPVERAEYLTYYDYDVEKIRQLVEYICADTDFTKYHKRELILDWFMSVDIETTTLQPGASDLYPDNHLSFPYLYQIRLGNCNILIRERHIFRACIDQIAGILNSKGLTLIAYDHNISFEWQFFKTILDIDRDSVFAIKARRIAKFTTNGGAIEWRCSYLLSNMGLEKFAENYAPPQYRKDKELIDYEVARYPWTQLSGEILYYSIMDVVSLEASVKELMSREGDNLKTIPMTNTGYVRRDARRACLGENTKHYRSEEEKESYRPFLLYRRMFCKTALTLPQYQILCDAFRGGNTHANRFFVGRVLPDPEDEKIIGHEDYISSYPAEIVCSREFPMGRLMDCTNSLQTLDDITWYVRNYWLVVRVVFVDTHLKNPYKTKCPYIPFAKMTRREHKKDCVNDNGRLISQDGAFEFCFLGVEWDIIRSQYTGKIKVLEAYYCPKGYLPAQLRKNCFEWFRKKTELKHVDGFEYEYAKSKNRANAYFGMMVERIVKDIQTVAEDLSIELREPTDEEAQKQLDDFYSPMQRKFLAFQWGVTITALARVEHMRLVSLVGDDFIYGDTDSIFYLNPSKHRAAIDRHNEIWKKYIAGCGMEYSATTKKGELQILGIADPEPPVQKFVTLGAKKYAMEYMENGKKKLEITVAGVPKKAGAALLGDIRNFKPGFEFFVGDDASLEDRQSWKKTLHYHDNEPFYIHIDGHDLMIGTGIGITRAPYNLDITGDYSEITGYAGRYNPNEILIYEQDDVW